MKNKYINISKQVIIITLIVLCFFNCSNPVEQINVEDLKTPCEHVDAFQKICSSISDKALIQQLSNIEKKMESTKDTLVGNDLEIVSKYEKAINKAQEVFFQMKYKNFTALEVEACQNSKLLNENINLISSLFKTTKIILKKNNRRRQNLLSNKSNNASEIDTEKVEEAPAVDASAEAPVEESTNK